MIKNLCIAALAVFLLSSCCITRSPIMGMLVTDVTVPSDASYEAALNDALKSSGAKGLKNIVVDHKIKNILRIVAEYTTIVRGIPIK